MSPQFCNVIIPGSLFMEWILIYVPQASLSKPGLASPFSKEVLFFIKSSKARKRSLLIFEIQFPRIFIFLRLFNTTRNGKWSLKKKWITLYLLMKKPLQWFIKTKIMMITSHRIQAEWTRDHLQYLILQKQHQPYG